MYAVLALMSGLLPKSTVLSIAGALAVLQGLADEAKSQRAWTPGHRALLVKEHWGELRRFADKTTKMHIPAPGSRYEGCADPGKLFLACDGRVEVPCVVWWPRQGSSLQLPTTYPHLPPGLCLCCHSLGHLHMGGGTQQHGMGLLHHGSSRHYRAQLPRMESTIIIITSHA